MKIISHRGNLFGSETSNENTIDSILKAIDYGFDVEIDIWKTPNGIYLGHDEPEYLVSLEWLNKFSNHLWVHAKNKEVISTLCETNLNWFWHENDLLTITSKGFIWCNIGVYIDGGITVCIDKNEIPKNIYGICTDFPVHYK